MWRALSLCVGLISAPAAAYDLAPEPSAGEAIVFDVYRNGGTPFGTHAVEFEREGEDVIASISIRLRAGVGPITVFRYEHDSTERWRDGQLIGKAGRTLKDGETYTISAVLDGGALQVEGVTPDGAAFTDQVDAAILPSSHWHGYPVDMQTMLNTEHGTLMDTTVEYLGLDEIEADGERISAHHFRLSSSLVVDLWYDEEGRWAGCAFEARGQTVRYVRRADPTAS